jgi:hypothetical protein
MYPTITIGLMLRAKRMGVCEEIGFLLINHR